MSNSGPEGLPGKPGPTHPDKLPDDIAELIAYWIIDYVPIDKLDLWDEMWSGDSFDECLDSLKMRMDSYLEYQKQLEEKISGEHVPKWYYKGDLIS